MSLFEAPAAQLFPAPGTHHRHSDVPPAADDAVRRLAMTFNHRLSSSFDPGQLASPSYSHSSTNNHLHHRSPQSPATGAEGLSGFDNAHHHHQHHQSYQQQHNQAPSHLQLPSTTNNHGTGGAFPQMRTAAPPHLALPSGPQFSLPSMHNSQESGQQRQQQFGQQITSPQPYSPGSHAQYNLPMGAATHLRPTWPQQAAAAAAAAAMAPPPPMMQNQMHPPPMMFAPGAHHHDGGPGSGGYHAGYYGQPAPHQERPFKCEQCKAAFSRNHDLKRHKRIHLAVKPFPCDFCEKTFTRKDALKRHRLVKGCEAKARARQDGDSPPLDHPKLKSGDSDSTLNEKRTPPATP